jgi:hypothetical protein
MNFVFLLLICYYKFEFDISIYRWSMIKITCAPDTFLLLKHQTLPLPHLQFGSHNQTVQLSAGKRSPPSRFPVELPRALEQNHVCYGPTASGGTKCHDCPRLQAPPSWRAHRSHHKCAPPGVLIHHHPRPPGSRGPRPPDRLCYSTVHVSADRRITTTTAAVNSGRREYSK